MSHWFAAVAGVAVAGLALASAELVAGLERSWRSPMLDVGDRVVDGAPLFVKEFAIATFGTNDKPALLIGIGVMLALFAAVVVGIGGLRWRLPVGLAGVAVFGLIGVWAVMGRRTGAPWHAMAPSVVGTIVGLGSLVMVERTGRRSRPVSAAVDVTTSRRQFVGGAGVLVAGLVAASVPLAASGRWLARRFAAAESRAAVDLPAAAEPLGPLPAGVEVGVAGIAPFVTPNSEFYRIDTALVVPQLPTDGYRLRVTGYVDHELELSYEDLLARRLVERDITLTCVSNQVGGSLLGNARWLGCRLDELLAEAGIQDRADQVVGRAVDGYTGGFPIETLRDGRDALVVVGMNGEPLPIEHGFPVRLVVPGLYGYLSATKWLTEIELTRFDEFDHYWVGRGYAPEAPIKLMSRIDVPRGLSRLPAGPAAAGGVAWAQTTGIAAVEVSIDGGEWQRCELGRVPSNDTWVQWCLDWDATPGRHTMTVRATDRSGAIQTPDRSEPLPDGATGHHQIVVIVE